MGYKPEDHDYYHQGKEAHDIIQNHVSGKVLSDDLSHLVEEVDGVKKPIYFPIVEQVDFDPRCKFSFFIKPMSSAQKDLFSKQLEVGSGVYTSENIQSEYEIRGYFDGHDPEKGRLLEIKSSSTMWSLGQFHSLMQRKVYALAKPLYTEFIGITCHRDLSTWKNVLPKVYRMPLTATDRAEAFQWILGAIKIIESGDYSGGLDENGKCVNQRCYFGKNCQFK